jgi:glycosyltransferase involved in cell wall biosynthesis
LFTVIVPVHNHEGILENSINALAGYLKKKFRKNWQMILAEHGSTDKSAVICRKIARETKQIKYAQLQKTLNLIKGDVIIIEPELTNNSKLIGHLVNGLKDKVNGPDIFNGSRFVKGAKYNASLSRRILSKFYNIMINVVFGTKLSDFQCEFKGYRENVFKHLCMNSDINYHFWFTESLVRAAKMDYDIRDFPVVYEKKWELSIKDAGARLKKVAHLKRTVR